MAENSKIEFSGSLQLEMIKGAQELTFNDGQRYLCIPIDTCPMIKRGKKDPSKINLGISIFRNNQPDKFGQTHYIRLSLNQDAQNYYDDNQKREMTRICGNLKPVTPKAQAAPAPQGPAYGGGYNQPAPAPQGPAYGSGYQQPAPQGPAYPQGGQPAMPAGARPAPGIGGAQPQGGPYPPAGAQPFGPANPATPYTDLPPDYIG